MGFGPLELVPAPFRGAGLEHYCEIFSWRTIKELGSTAVQSKKDFVRTEGGSIFLLLLELPLFWIFGALYIWIEVAGKRTSRGVGVVLTPEL